MSTLDDYPEISLNYNYFLKNEKRFIRKYGHAFLLIKNKRVVGVFENSTDAYVEAVKKYKLGTFNIQECPNIIQNIYLTNALTPFII